MESIQQNIDARKEAEAFIEMAGEKPQRFWEVIAAFAAKKLPQKPEPKDKLAPLDDKLAIEFETWTMPFGKYAGREIGLIPCDYLTWFEDDEFRDWLKRYVKSDRFKKRQQEAEPEESDNG